MTDNPQTKDPSTTTGDTRMSGFALSVTGNPRIQYEPTDFERLSESLVNRLGGVYLDGELRTVERAFTRRKIFERSITPKMCGSIGASIIYQRTPEFTTEYLSSLVTKDFRAALVGAADELSDWYNALVEKAIEVAQVRAPPMEERLIIATPEETLALVCDPYFRVEDDSALLILHDHLCIGFGSRTTTARFKFDNYISALEKLEANLPEHLREILHKE